MNKAAVLNKAETQEQGEALGHESVVGPDWLLDATCFVPEPSAVACLPEQVARRDQLVPVHLDESRHQLVLACASMPDVLVRDRLARQLGESIEPVFHRAPGIQVAAALDRCYGASLVMEDILDECRAARGHATDFDDSYRWPVVRLVDALLQVAVIQRASDIHLSPEAQEVGVRLRIDGLLRALLTLPRSVWPAMSVRLKVLAGVDVAETRHPQDGQFTRRIHGEDITFRLSSFPLVDGENAVLRVLDRRQSVLRLEALGLPVEQVYEIRALMQRPDGLTVLCGPTGSGKTTTLYALLSVLDTRACNVMTLEDPVEYPMPGIRQTSIDANRGLDVATGLKHLLRQDPDVILVGEIRDAAGAELALRAALTGHHVLTTVHATSPVGAVRRLLDLGLDRTSLASTLNAVLSQRLLRTLCVACHGAGDAQHACHACQGEGFVGRAPIVEQLVVDPELRAQLLAGASLNRIEAGLPARGHVALRARAEQMQAAGRTSVDETVRVLGLPEHDSNS